MNSELTIPGFLTVDFYPGDFVVLGWDGRYYVLSRQSFEQEVFFAAGNVVEKLLEYLQTANIPTWITHPVAGIEVLNFEVPAPKGVAFGLGPLKEPHTPANLTSFIKAQHNGAAYGQPIAIISGEDCNIELEVVAYVVNRIHCGFFFGIDAGKKGVTEDRVKGYPGAAGFSSRIFLGSGELPDKQLRLQISDPAGKSGFIASRSSAEYLTERNPNTLLPLFLDGERAREFGSAQGMGIFLGAACNSAKDPNFRAAAGMEVTGYYGDAKVLSHRIVETQLPA